MVGRAFGFFIGIFLCKLLGGFDRFVRAVQLFGQQTALCQGIRLAVFQRRK